MLQVRIKKKLGNFLLDVDFSMDGGIFAILGASGCGKSMTLKCIAGIERPDEGRIVLNDRVLFDSAKRINLPPQKRKVGYMFQDYALFPAMNVVQNIQAGMGRKPDPKKVREYITGFQLGGLEHHMPDQLSGGQKQRVAMARMLAAEPEVLLLDEPFAAIDAKVRQELRTWLRETIDKIGITSIFVTHDQDEAIEVADEIIITNEGRVEQMGDPVEIYLHPKTPFVAQFIGKSSIIEEYGKLKGFDSIGSDTRAIIRPEFVEIKSPKDVTEQSSIYEQAAVEQSIFRGNYFEVLLNIKGITIRTNSPLVNGPLKSGDKVWVVINQMYVFDDKTTTTLTNKGLDVSSMYYI
mgnify:CR=1 FL=1